MNRTILLAKLPIANQPANKTVHVELSFCQGGHYAFTPHPRGFYLSACVRSVSESNGFIHTQSNPMNGVCQCIEEARRFNSRRLETLASEIKSNPNKFAHLVEHTVAKEGLQLAAPTPA